MSLKRCLAQIHSVLVVQSQNLFHLGHAGSKPADSECFFPIRICLKICSWTVSSGDQLLAKCRFKTYRRHFFFLSDHGGLEDCVVTRQNQNLSNLLTDTVFMPSWFTGTHGQFLDGPFPLLVLAKWLAESKSVPLGLRSFET
ncbi:hypothetical protein BD769DRAFT_1401913 [Suillus cothurnatus]|nr:hypothetical protein BD769DRAFT_1401913 [Suillus cothurnatus]